MLRSPTSPARGSRKLLKKTSGSLNRFGSPLTFADGDATARRMRTIFDCTFQFVEYGAHTSRGRIAVGERDRKSTRLNSSHVSISYAVFCLKKKKTQPALSIAA